MLAHTTTIDCLSGENTENEGKSGGEADEEDGRRA